MQYASGGDVNVRVYPDNHGVHRGALCSHLSPGQVSSSYQCRLPQIRQTRSIHLDRRSRLLRTDRRTVRRRLRPGTLGPIILFS